MRKLVLYELLTLDGVADDPDAFILDFDEVMGENLARVISTQDTVILGRHTYDEWAAFWPESDIEPFASFINGVEKYVVTSSPLQLSWNNTTVAHGALAELVETLKSQPGGDIGVHGSVTLSRSLLAQGLVDEMRLVIAPSFILGGHTLFEDAKKGRFEVTQNVTSPSGYLLIDLRLA